MNKRFVQTLYFIGGFYILLFMGCVKETSGSLNPSSQQEQTIATVSAQSEIETQLAFNDVFDNVIGANNQVGMAGTGIFGRVEPGSNGFLQQTTVERTDTAHCFIVSSATSGSGVFPIQLNIDFGNGCMGKDGHMRYGKISTIYTGRITETGSIATTTFENYKIDSFTISGTHIITNTSNGGQRQFKVEIKNARISKPSGNYVEWNCERTIVQTQGNLTPDWPLDDVFTINGSSYGKVQNGNDLFAWKAEISEPLIKEFICPWLLKGTLEVRRDPSSANSKWTALLDYGQGLCDNKATLTINGMSTQITLY